MLVMRTLRLIHSDSKPETFFLCRQSMLKCLIIRVHLGDTDKHIGVTESYGRTRVGYERFQVAVDDVIGCFKKQTVKDIKKLKGDRTWRGKLNFDLTSILYMSIEPVRFRWLSTDYYLYEIAVKSKERDATDGEVELIGSWGSVLDCSFRDGSYDITTMDLSITVESVRGAVRYPKLARHCVVGIRDMAMYAEVIERDMEKMGIQIEGIQRLGDTGDSSLGGSGDSSHDDMVRGAGRRRNRSGRRKK
ncbi:hypothetical protein Tco_1292417 [Tanacetum coccineum]